jgi:hypothetical protein
MVVLSRCLLNNDVPKPSSLLTSPWCTARVCYSYSLCVQNLPFGGSTSALTVGQATFLHAANWENGQTGLYVLRQAPSPVARVISSRSRPVSAIDPSSSEGSRGNDNSLVQVKRPRSAPAGPALQGSSYDASHLDVVLESSNRSHSSLSDFFLDGALGSSAPMAACNPTVRASTSRSVRMSA